MARIGQRRVVIYGGALTALGMVVVVLSPWSAVSPFGLGLVALGAANTLPVLFSAASRVAGTTTGAGIAAASTGALLGLLAGPPFLGFIAHAGGLATAVASLAFVGLVVAGGALSIRWPVTPTVHP